MCQQINERKGKFMRSKADRYRVGSRATAALVNAALKDMGLLNESNLLERNKVERERKRVGKAITISKKN